METVLMVIAAIFIGIAALVVFGKVLWALSKLFFALGTIAVYGLIAIAIVYFLTHGLPT